LVPICVTGMPFSGTAIVARVLRELGLDLGPDEELLPGHGTIDDALANGRFARLNEEILAAVGNGWDSPPADSARWADRPQLEAVRQRAAVICGALAIQEPWGWADTRSLFSVPFWRELFPDLHVVVCVRDPQEVARLLETGGSISYSEGLALWRSYYRASAEIGDNQLIVTDYSGFHGAPKAQVERLTEGIGLHASKVKIERAVASLTASGGPPEVVRNDSELPPDIRDLFRTLLDAAASSPGRGRPRTGGSVAVEERGSAKDLLEAVAAQRAELEHLRLELARRRGQVEAIQVQLDVRTTSEDELRQAIHDLHSQLVERDDEVASLRADLMRRLDAEDCLQRAVDALEDKLASVETTRLWRLGKRYWSLKRSIGSALGRGKP
jgi:Sulfotransferase family